MNKYNEPELFEKYMGLHRSKSGVEASDEWTVYKTFLPNFEGKRVLDLGCGPGLHSEYAAANGASKVVGVDLSSRMVEQAASNSKFPNVVQYETNSISDIDYPANSFDSVISAMAFHYLPSFDDTVKRVKNCLVDEGSFVFSMANPIYTGCSDADWYHDNDGNILHWRVDRYFDEGRVVADFLGESNIYMYHRKLSTVINTLLDHGFKIIRVAEPEPEKREITDFSYELEVQRPRFLVISAQKMKQ
ncbi:hypothetical protein MFLAVUS_008342 [Mucor flavus]|uniref:Methyltransferase type 11 domain-containing protein n=1 Tax=Mucor flavus TaxID=439312 RepID=A0ABP9Z6X6_9FUNG